jgi:protein O-mannosyl-transferase
MIPLRSKYFWVVLASLFLLVLISFRGVLENGFVLNWDDFEYVTENPMIQKWDSAHLLEMFTSFHSANWHPLTWISHALDYQLYGLDPWGHHLTSLILHGLNTCGVFVLFVLMASVGREEDVCDYRVWAGGVFAALLFGLHPLRIESVAWISERKDLLCSFFYFAAIGAYFFYVREKKRGGYGVLAFLFTLALMSKPMAVTLPVVLLLLDVFPLGRLRTIKGLPLVLQEKIPLFVLSLAGVVMTLMAQGSTGAIRTLSETSLLERVLNAFYALWFYLEKTLWPKDLLPFYPFRESLSWFDMGFLQGLIIFVGVTWISVYQWKKGNHVWMITWLFYLVTVAPVIGIIKVGTQAMADRYTYIPVLGPVFLAGAGILRLWKKNKFRPVLFLVTVVMVFALSILSSSQIRIWQDGKSLWVPVVEAFPGKVNRAHANLAVHYFQEGQLEKAEEQLQIAMKIQPDQVDNYFYLGMIYSRQGRFNQAGETLQKALTLDPEDERVLHRQGMLHEKMGKNDLAEAKYNEALSLDPDIVPVRIQLGQLLLKTGRIGEAEEEFKKVLALNPDSEEGRNNLGALYFQTGRFQLAEAEYQEAIKTWPRRPRAYTNLGVLYYETRKLLEAEEIYLKILERVPDHIEAINNLGVLYLEIKRNDEALRLLQSSKILNPKRADTLFYMGLVYMAEKNWQSAEVEFRASSVLNPVDVEVYNQLGIALARQKKWENSKEAFESALLLNPNHPSVKANLKRLNTSRGITK